MQLFFTQDWSNEWKLYHPFTLYNKQYVLCRSVKHYGQVQVCREHNFNQNLDFHWGGGQILITGGEAICSTAGAIAPPVNMLDEALMLCI